MAAVAMAVRTASARIVREGVFTVTMRRYRMCRGEGVPPRRGTGQREGMETASS